MHPTRGPAMASLKYRINAEFSIGPSLAAQGMIEVEGCNVVQVDIPAAPAAGAATPVAVELGTDKGEISFLTVSLAAGEYSDDLTYKVDGSSTVTPLDGPLFLVGAGAVSLLGAPPKKLTFTNGGPGAVKVHVLVGRDATA